MEMNASEPMDEERTGGALGRIQDGVRGRGALGRIQDGARGELLDGFKMVATAAYQLCGLGEITASSAQLPHHKRNIKTDAKSSTSLHTGADSNLRDKSEVEKDSFITLPGTGEYSRCLPQKTMCPPTWKGQ